MKKRVFSILIGIFAVGLVLAVCPYHLVATPNSKIFIIDYKGKPLTDVRVVRRWDTSENQKGEDQAVTDASGGVAFMGTNFTMSWLKRITKPLLILVPASCGPGWEVYGHTEFEIYSPNGYKPNFDDPQWKKVYATYENRDGINIYDPTTNTNFIGLYFFNKKADFEYTLKLSKYR
jgi:hypothetical protein